MIYQHRARVVLAIVAIGSRVLLAQDSYLDRCLNKADTQLAKNVCAEAEATRADDQLAGLYNRVVVTARRVGTAEKIDALQTAWTLYRDVYIDARFPAKDKLAAYGPTFQMDVLLLRAELTRRQIDAVRELLKHYEESK